MGVSTREVDGQLANINRKEIEPIPAVMRKLADGAPIYVHNIGPYRWIVPLGSLGTFTINKPEEGQELAVPLKLNAVIFETYATDMNKMAQRTWDGHDVANDIIGIGPFKGPQQDLRRWGVFISDSKTPTAKEIAAAKAALKLRWQDLIRDADDMYAQGPLQYGNITAEHRRALAAMNLGRESHPWASDIQEMMDCPGCGEKIKPGIAMHRACGAIINLEKAIELGMVAPPEEKPKGK